MNQAGKRAAHVLVVDDEADIRDLISLSLTRMGCTSECAGSLAAAHRHLARSRFQLCLTDMRLPDGEGLTLVRDINLHHPGLPVAVITAHGNMENAVEALKAGAFDYLSKPVSLEQLRDLVCTAISEPLQRDNSETLLIGSSPALQQVRELIHRLARNQAPVYISGESGSGKELAARLIHRGGARADAPFIAVNCGAIPENLMESEFFGYRKGAFTGATEDRDGFFQAAHGGTLFLDEVADLPLAMQVKLLRAIQEKCVRKVGATSEEPLNVRLISATHRDLKALVTEGKFRQDLFYRLNVIDIRMPSLREYAEDIPVLCTKIIERLASASARTPPQLSPEALQQLKQYPYPGNVRELENILERALALMDGERIEATDLQIGNTLSGIEHNEGVVATLALGQLSLQDYLDQLERQAIREALHNSRYNITAAARVLGVSFRSLRYRMERLGLRE